MSLECRSDHADASLAEDFYDRVADHPTRRRRHRRTADATVLLTNGPITLEFASGEPLCLLAWELENFARIHLERSKAHLVKDADLDEVDLGFFARGCCCC